MTVVTEWLTMYFRAPWSIALRYQAELRRCCPQYVVTVDVRAKVDGLRSIPCAQLYQELLSCSTGS